MHIAAVVIVCTFCVRTIIHISNPFAYRICTAHDITDDELQFLERFFDKYRISGAPALVRRLCELRDSLSRSQRICYHRGDPSNECDTMWILGND